MRVVPKYSEIFLPCSPMKQHFNARTEVAAGRGGGRSGRNRPACRVVTLSCWPSPRQHGRETQLCRDRRSFLIYVLRCVCGLSLSLPPLLGLGISSESHFYLRAPRRVGVAVRGGVGRSAEHGGRRSFLLDADAGRRAVGGRDGARGGAACLARRANTAVSELPHCGCRAPALGCLAPSAWKLAVDRGRHNGTRPSRQPLRRVTERGCQR